MITMADLTPGTRIRHINWQEAGTIRVLGGVVAIVLVGAVLRRSS